MQEFRAVAITLIVVALLAGAAHAQGDGATITFTDTKTVIYEGTGEMRAERPTECPVTVGNFRITKVRLPAQSNRDNVGLVIPFRGALSERMVNLDPRWDGRAAPALVCEVIDPDAPIGFRMRAHARVRMFHSPGSWLSLKLGRGPNDDRAIPAAAYNARFTGDTHRWYVLSTMREIYRRGEEAEAPASDRFAILPDTAGRGSWWIKWLEIKPWPTVVEE